jgi:hypothetical protein
MCAVKLLSDPVPSRVALVLPDLRGFVHTGIDELIDAGR